MATSSKKENETSLFTAASSISERKQDLCTPNKTTILTSTFNKPKFSFEFSKWLDSQKTEEPSLHADLQNALSPTNQRDYQG